MNSETEIKFLASASALALLAKSEALKAVVAGPSRTVKLRSVYWDTSDFALQREGITLRMRHSPAGWIQTLKAEGDRESSLYTRDEREWPIANGNPDLTLAGATRRGKVLRRRSVGEALHPIFETVVSRTTQDLRFDDGTQAELALDRGDVVSGSGSDRKRTAISEVEIELKSGNEQRLFELSLAILEEGVPLVLSYATKAARGYALIQPAMGAPRRAQDVPLDPDLSAAEALQRIATECLAQIHGNIDEARKSALPRCVHQLRVGVRRLRTCGTLCKARGTTPLPQDLTDELHWIWDLTGAVRNADVFAEELWPALAKAGREADSGHTLSSFEARASAQRAKHRRALSRAMASPRCQKLLLRLAAFFGGYAKANDTTGLTSGKTVCPFAQSMLEERLKALKKAGPDLAQASAECRHRVRIDAKKLRYIAEFFVALYPKKPTKKYLRALHELQAVLGALNDLATTSGVFEQASSGGKRKNRFDREAYVAGLVHGFHQGAEAKWLQELASVWPKFLKQRPFWS